METFLRLQLRRRLLLILLILLLLRILIIIIITTLLIILLILITYTYVEWSPFDRFGYFWLLASVYAYLDRMAAEARAALRLSFGCSTACACARFLYTADHETGQLRAHCRIRLKPRPSHSLSRLSQPLTALSQRALVGRAPNVGGPRRRRGSAATEERPLRATSSRPRARATASRRATRRKLSSRSLAARSSRAGQRSRACSPRPRRLRAIERARSIRDGAPGVRRGRARGRAARAAGAFEGDVAHSVMVPSERPLASRGRAVHGARQTTDAPPPPVDAGAPGRRRRAAVACPRERPARASATCWPCAAASS